MPLLLFLWTLVAAAEAPRVVPARAAAARQAPARDPLARLQSWIDRVRKGREDLDARAAEALHGLVSDARTAWAVDPGRGTEIATALLDLLGLCIPSAGLEGADGGAAQTRDLTLAALRVHINPEFLRWLSRDVLAMQSQPIERRIAAIAVLQGGRDPAALLPLLSCAREGEPRIRFAALEALCGLEDEGVHAVFLDELARSLAGTADSASWIAEAHFRQVLFAPRSPLLPRLAALVARGLASSDWREVSRAVALGRPLDHESIVPFLIEALARWKSREEAGAQALRVEIEILRALEERSGRKLGPSPESWSAWWRAVRRGDVKGQTPQTGGFPESTRASFFGVAPATDRVTFVVDRSGSMATALGPGTGRKAETRWEESVEQLLGFVDAVGPRARFGIVLFHDYAEEWRPALVQADEAGRKAARAWLSNHHPGGGTQLRSGVHRAMRVQADGLPDLAALEADTIILLCDGETAEGPDWVEPFLRRANARARIVFHCVKVGPGGDGTLEKLAAGSGGDFVRVDG